MQNALGHTTSLSAPLLYLYSHPYIQDMTKSDSAASHGGKNYSCLDILPTKHLTQQHIIRTPDESYKLPHQHSFLQPLSFLPYYVHFPPPIESVLCTWQMALPQTRTFQCLLQHL